MNTSIPSGDAVGIQFGLITTEDVEKLADGQELGDLPQSVKKGVAAFNTVTSPLMGTQNASTLCGRCGGDLEHCQGHFCKLTLFQPICNANFFPVLPKVFASQCVRCSRLLVPDDHPRLAKSLKKANNYKHAVNATFADVQRYKICWFPPNISDSKKTKAAACKQRQQDNNNEPEDPEELPHMLSSEEARIRGYCGAKQPDMWIRDEDVLIRPVYYITEKEDFDILPKITPRHLYNMLKFASASTTRILGFDPIFSPLCGMMAECLLVPPLIIRPTRSAHGAEDDITKTLRTIQEHNTKAQRDVIPNLTLGLIRTAENMHYTATTAKKKMIRVQGPMSTTLLRKKVPVVPACLDDFFLVQRAAACLWDSKYHKNLDAEYGREPFSLKRRFAPGKRNKGRMRQSMLGKPGDFTMRGAATPNTDNDVDEVGLPRRGVMHITWPEHVNALNFNAMLELVLNGEHKYPGCNYVQRNETLYLPTANFGGLRIGDIVHRHLRTGDWVIVNRQPSLYRFAIMGYRVQVSPDDTIDSHLGITTVLGLDYDGDEMNIYAPQNLLERAETAHLMSVPQNLMKDGKLMIGFVQHAVLGAYKLTEENAIQLTEEEITEYLLLGKKEECIRDAVNRWEQFNSCKSLTGREFMSILLPTYVYKPGDPPLTKTTLNVCMGATIETAGHMEFAASRIGFLTRILENFCRNCGVSLHLDDCNISKPPKDIQARADAILADATEIATDLERSLTQKQLAQWCPGVAQEKHHDNNNSLVASMDEEEAEEDVCILTGRYRDLLGSYAVKKLRAKENGAPSGMCDIVDSKSKGTEVNITQNVIVVGQQMNENSMRYTDSTNHYYRNVLARYGFIDKSFFDGLTPTQLFSHLRASRVGLISTACHTSDSGYLYRKLFKSVEDERVSFDNSIRNANGHIILFEYGFDTTFLHSIPLRTVSMTLQDIVAQFTTPIMDENEDDDPCSIDEVERLLILREQVIEHDPKLSISIPVRFEKQFQCTDKHCKHRTINKNAVRNRVMNMWKHLTTKCGMMSSPIYELMFFEQMATRVLVDRNVLQCVHVFEDYMQYVQETFAINICAAGSPAGMDAAQSSTQPLTQTGLKRFHITGEKTTIVTGVTRLREIINLTRNIERPLMYVFLLPEFEDSFDPMELIELRLAHVVTKYHDSPVLCNHLEQLPMLFQNVRDEDDDDLIHLSLYLNKSTMENRRLLPREVAGYLLNTQILQLDPENVHVTHANLDDEIWWITLTLLRKSKILLNLVADADELITIPAPLLSLKLQHALVYDKQLLAGVANIRDFALIEKEIIVSDENEDDRLVMRKRKCYLTMGSNLQAVCAIPGVDLEYTTSNDIHQVFQVYGVDAAQLAIEENLMEAMQTSDATVAAQHIKLIAATMCFCGSPAALTYSGMVSKSTASWYKRACFEQSLNSFLGAAVSGHKDNLRGVSEAIVCGTSISLGSGGDFRMIPTSSSNAPPQPKRKRFEFQTPDISSYCNLETAPLTEDAITLNFNSSETNDTEQLVIKHTKRTENSSAKRMLSNQMADNMFCRKGATQLLRPSSPISSSSLSSFGSMQVLVPSSPKKRKISQRRKPRKGDLPINDDTVENLQLEPLTQFFETISTTKHMLVSDNDVWHPSSP